MDRYLVDTDIHSETLISFLKEDNSEFSSLISLINVEVGINVEGVQKLQNQ